MITALNKTRKVTSTRTPVWKLLLIGILVVLAVIYALPNIYGELPAVQVSPKGGKQVDAALVKQVNAVLAQQRVEPLRTLSDTYHIEVRFADHDQQLLAKEALSKALGAQYTVALTLSPNTPNWLLAMGATPMKLGLDLRGGMYFLLDIDTQTVLDNALSNYTAEIRKGLREKHIRYQQVTFDKQHMRVVVQFQQPAGYTSGVAYLAERYRVLKRQLNQAHNRVYLTLTEQEANEVKRYAADQTVQVMRNRVNELGVAEASVAKEGNDRVVIELPGVQDAAQAKEVLGGTATLKVMLVDDQADLASAVAGRPPLGASLYYTEQGRPVLLRNRVVLTGNAVTGARAGFDQQSNLPAVFVRLTGPEVSYFSRVTGQNVGHRMAILLVNKLLTKKVGPDGKSRNVVHTQERVISVATINSKLGNNFVITGVGTSREAKNLSLLIRAGALPAPVQIVQEKHIGPSLGLQNIEMGKQSVVIAMALVVLFMLVYYRFFGFVADCALLLNLVFIVAVMSIIPGAALTLPGIAGIVLNVGMAIDSNVLIFERIREELRNGVTPHAAINAGYDRAFSTIVDANVTTLIVAVILFAVGTGAVKGFAVTLIIGILTSMFTAITFTRAVVNVWYGKRRQLKTISIGI